MISKIQAWVDRANDRLKKGKIGVTLVLQGKSDWLYLRGTFPPKPGSNRRKPYQTKVALKLRAIDEDSIQQAELIAREIGLELNKGTFDWRKFSDYEDPAQRTIAQWIEVVEANWWQGRDRANPSHQNSWRVYAGVLRSLPSDELLSVELLHEWIEANSAPTDSMRAHYWFCANLLAAAADLPSEPLRNLKSQRKRKLLNPRSLPTDVEIVAIRNRITNPGWQRVFGLMAAYGLRNHEVWNLDYSDFPIVRVAAYSKTGARPVKPLYPEWATEWGLENPELPIVKPHACLGNMGAKVTHWFQDQLAAGIKPYDLRHCYVRRCVEFGVPPDVAAQLCGHTLQVHLKIYRCWIGEKVYLDAVDRVTNRSDRPLPPIPPDI